MYFYFTFSTYVVVMQLQLKYITSCAEPLVVGAYALRDSTTYLGLQKWTSELSIYTGVRLWSKVHG